MCNMKCFTCFLFSVLCAFALNGQNGPIDFEPDGNGADWTWTVFENDSNPPLEIIANPDPSGLNTSATVAKFTALQTGMPFAGCESMHGAGIGSFTIDADNSIIRILVWKSVISDVGIKLVRADNWSLGEIKIANTLVNEWEQIEFDFSAHIGNTYDQIVIFPDFNARAGDNIIYFDGIYGEEAFSSQLTGIEEAEISLSPNPAKSTVELQSDKILEEYQIFSLAGQLIRTETVRGTNAQIDVSALPVGTYLLKAISEGQTIVEKFVKQ